MSPKTSSRLGNVALNTLLSAEDAFLGAVGKAIPPSEVVDHATRFFGTWSGSEYVDSLYVVWWEYLGLSIWSDYRVPRWVRSAS